MTRDPAEALDEIEEYSHLIIIFWMHQTPEQDKKKVKVHPKHDQSDPLVGVFAVRERSRPNPIGLAVAGLLQRNQNVKRVRGLDALDGSPVLDIKSLDFSDMPERIRVPEWWMMKSRDSRGTRTV